jgi:hypothetical protein
VKEPDPWGAAEVAAAKATGQVLHHLQRAVHPALHEHQRATALAGPEAVVVAEGPILQQAKLRDLSAEQAECGLAEFASALGQFGANADAATEDAQRSPHGPSADGDRSARTRQGRARQRRDGAAVGGRHVP